MNSSNKKMPGARGVPQPFNRQAGRAPVQAKTAIPSQPKNRPAAPPVYRPQSGPKVLQAKQAVGRQPTPQPKPSSPARGSGVIQRNCGTPGCADPTCTDPSRHGFGHVYGLRSGPLYTGTVTPGHIGTGTGTSTTTRTHVNSSTTTYPQEIRIEYSTGTGTGHSEFTNTPLASGQRADAGHIFGRQYGGYGGDTASVFPQHPQTNRGNSYQGEPTRHLWRAHEDDIRARAQGGTATRVAVHLRDAPRTRFPYCSRCDRVFDYGTTRCDRCGGATA